MPGGPLHVPGKRTMCGEAVCVPAVHEHGPGTIIQADCAGLLHRREGAVQFVLTALAGSGVDDYRPSWL